MRDLSGNAPMSCLAAPHLLFHLLGGLLSRKEGGRPEASVGCDRPLSIMTWMIDHGAWQLPLRLLLLVSRTKSVLYSSVKYSNIQDVQTLDQPQVRLHDQHHSSSRAARS